jgi:hypothetical protein
MTTPLIGCGGSSNGRLEVSGMVTLDGRPLDQGSIEFNDPNGKLPSSGAVIANGAYNLPAAKGLQPGSYKAAIDSADPTGQTATPTQYSMAIPVSRIPLKYNGETTLTVDVTADGDNEFDFQLESAR